MWRNPSSPIRIGAWTTAIALIAALAILPAAAQSLHEVWTSLIGKKGVLEERDCGFVWTLSAPTQSGNAVVQSVRIDHVVLLVERDQKKLEYVIPLAQITLRTDRG